MIVSWEVPGHLSNPRDAFEAMAKLLKSGGYAFHEYNPFFSLNWGHSLCTLDFLWGHARLGKKDFIKYIDQFRPKEKNGGIPESCGWLVKN